MNRIVYDEKTEYNYFVTWNGDRAVDFIKSERSIKRQAVFLYMLFPNNRVV